MSMPHGPTEKTYNTIVIGLGAAGTVAAAQLAKAGHSVLALEAQDRVGGRVHTIPVDDGVIEVGAEWIHGTRTSMVYDVAKSNRIPLQEQELDFWVYRSDGGEVDQKLMNELVEYCLEVQLGSEAPDFPEPLGEFITRKLKDYLQRKHPHILSDAAFVSEFLEFMNLLVDNYEASNDWNDVSAWSMYEEIPGHQHMSWGKLGYRTFFDIVLNKYKNGPGLKNLETKLNCEVTRIEWTREPDDFCTVTCKDGSVYHSDNVIVTVSLGVLKESPTLFDPKLPEEKTRIISALSFGVSNKIMMYFSYTWWIVSKDHWLGFQWSSDTIANMAPDDLWVTKICQATFPMGSDNVITLWICGDEGILGVGNSAPCVLASIGYCAHLDAAKRLDLSAVRSHVIVTNDFLAAHIPNRWRDYIPLYKHATLFSPRLPTDKAKVIDNLSMGLIDKIVLTFPTAWWPKNVSFFAFMWKGEDRTVPKEDFWTTKIFMATTPFGSEKSLTLWTNGDVAKLVETLPEDVVKRKCMDVLKRFIARNVDIPEPTSIIRSKWYSNPYTRGSYTFDNLLVAEYPNARKSLSEPLTDSAGKPRVMFAGEATHSKHFSTVHGAAETGHREAKRLISKPSKL